jgi:hypothetical protein
MRTIARCFLLFGLVVVVPRVAAAQATLAGEVKDATGAVLPGVTVEAAGPALVEKVRTAVTDGSGRYRIESLPPGSYTVTFSLTGFVPVNRKDVIVSGAGVITVDVALTVAAAETITVTARRRDDCRSTYRSRSIPSPRTSSRPPASSGRRISWRSRRT